MAYWLITGITNPVTAAAGLLNELARQPGGGQGLWSEIPATAGINCRDGAHFRAMNVRLAPVLIVLGFLVAAFGAVMGLTPIHRLGISCGSAFRPNHDAATVQDFTNAFEADSMGINEDDPSAVTHACSAAVSDRKPIALGATIPGAIVLLVGAGIAAREHWTAEEAHQSSESAPAGAPE
jgi:hypothetical protein